MLNKDEVKRIIGAIRNAGEAIMDFYQDDKSALQTYIKSDDSPLTIADTTANDLICTFLKRNFPEIPIISEEKEIEDYEIRKNWTYLWLLDPLDGTKEFLNRTDEFSINLALIHDHSVVAGFIYLPVFDEMYYAIRGQGAFHILEEDSVKPLNVNTFSLKNRGLNVMVSRSHQEMETQKYLDELDEPNLLTKGSSLKFINIAKGEADYYPRMIHIMEWDTAAGQIIIEEAGGSLVDAINGLPLSYNKPSVFNPYFIASGKIID
jgi:3'(2'), 5'-bisphosphate nucleotidase